MSAMAPLRGCEELGTGTSQHDYIGGITGRRSEPVPISSQPLRLVAAEASTRLSENRDRHPTAGDCTGTDPQDPGASPGFRTASKSEITYHIASTRAERAAAFRLVHQAYARAGLSEEQSHGLRITPYQLLPTTEIFYAQHDGTMISTVSLVRDGELGLPMESIYGEEVADRREQGLKLAEVSCLADRRSDPKRFFDVFMQQCRMMAQFSKRQGVHQVLVAVHPRHARFYKRFLGFEPIGDEQAYPAVRGNPAVPLCFDFDRIEREHPAVQERFFGEQIPPSLLRPCPMPRVDREHFASMVEATDDVGLLYNEDDSSRRNEMALSRSA